MNYKDIISVANAKVATYDNSSKLAFEFPGEEHFTKATDLKILGKTDHIALIAELCNMRAFENKSKGLNTTLTLTLNDSDNNQLLCSRSVPVKIKRSEFSITLRIDFPLEVDHSKPLLHYSIKINCENGEELLEIPIRLYDLTLLKLLPTKFYHVEKAYVSYPYDSADRHLKSLGREYSNCATRVNFILTSKLPEDIELPELQLRLVHSDGSESSEMLFPKRSEEWPLDLAESEIIASSVQFFHDNAGRGTYYAELLSMGYPIAGFVFSTDGEAQEGEWFAEGIEPLKPYSTEAAVKRLRQINARKDNAADNAEVAERTIDDLIGLDSVKTRLKTYTALIRFNQLRQEHGLPAMPLSLHSMFLGSPGTGKTTVAKIIGKTLREIGVLSSGHVVQCERATLLGKYYHSEAENVRKALDEARGGILFIDEAYQLYQPDDPKDPGKFVIETLLTALADESDRDWMLILAGYPEPMKRMFEMNPGLRSRIPAANIYSFEDFTAPELMDIARAHLQRYRFTLTREAESALRKRLEADYANRSNDFGNARHVVNLIENDVLPAMATRLSAATTPDTRTLCRIVASDIPAPAPVLTPAVRRLGFAV